MQAVCLLGGHKSTSVKHIHMLFPPACSFPLITEDLPGCWPGRYMGMDSPNNTVWTVPQLENICTTSQPKDKSENVAIL
jgi:hypothetical protein